MINYIITNPWRLFVVVYFLGTLNIVFPLTLWKFHVDALVSVACMNFDMEKLKTAKAVKTLFNDCK